MRTFVAGKQALVAAEFVELAYGFDELPTGIDRELFIGVPGESSEDRAARETVAREVLDDLRERGEADEVTAYDAIYAEALMHTVPLLRSSDRVLRSFRKGDAA
ncbi:hypothetical protein [Actinacidiphila oryziradicis]|uniref:Uncharacterized protein n=1 Tax=Actinacidiphila oryziradicis TaxID=2571141 RepID=A0A4U0RU43_9ACTN|nr:hypothetical protein [Actinacidiphila oryziradicis]TJZ99703.1 hypothetical protein FCI23_44760 [Actinacidiphila oryziradicis]